MGHCGTCERDVTRWSGGKIKKRGRDRGSPKFGNHFKLKQDENSRNTTLYKKEKIFLIRLLEGLIPGI